MEQSDEEIAEIEAIHEAGLAKAKEERLRRQMSKHFQDFANAILETQSTRPHTPSSCFTD